MQITGQHLIAGSWQRAAHPSFASHDPRHKLDLEWTFAEATEGEVNTAVEAALAAYEITRNYPASRIATLLKAIGDEIDALGDELVNMADLETGLGLPRLTGERTRTSNQMRAFADLILEGSYVAAIIDTALPDRKPAPRQDLRHMRTPLGPVAVFTPNNFPLAFGIAGGDTASALAAGCPVVAKGHPSHPATCELIAGAIQRALQKTEFPAGYFSLLHGQSLAVGKALVEHPGITAVGFTGSLRGGRALMDLAAARPTPIPVYAEMGSINPVIPLPNAIHNRASALADTLVESATLGAGQYCTNPGLLLLLDGPDTAAFIQTFAERMAARTPGVLLNAGVQANLTQAVTATTQKPSVSVIVGATQTDQACYSYANTVMQTTAEAFLKDPDLQHEHFGPVNLIVLCDSLVQLENVIRSLNGNLTGTLLADESDYDLVKSLSNLLREKVGRLILNGVPTGVEVVYAQNHGGPYPAGSVPAATSVGFTSIQRWMRPIAFQNFPNALLPEALQNENPLHLWRIVNGAYTNQSI